MILVVEGDLDLRETILDILEGAGFDVILAADGQEALDAVPARRRISLILLDPHLPSMDGLEFRRRQLQNPNLSGAPLVLLSSEPETRSEAETLGSVCALKEPFKEEDLLRIAARYCGDHSDS